MTFLCLRKVLYVSVKSVYMCTKSHLLFALHSYESGLRRWAVKVQLPKGHDTKIMLFYTFSTDMAAVKFTIWNPFHFFKASTCTIMLMEFLVLFVLCQIPPIWHWFPCMLLVCVWNDEFLAGCTHKLYFQWLHVDLDFVLFNVTSGSSDHFWN